MAVSVRIREEKLKDGRRSLYLDVYHNGRQKQPRLGIYLVPENTEEDIKRNKELMRIAEIKRNEVEMQVLNNKFGTEKVADRYQNDFVKYFHHHLLLRERSGINYVTWYCAYKHLNDFTGGNLSFREVNETWLEEMKGYMLKKVSPNSVISYLGIIKRMVHQAFRDKILDNDPALVVKCPSHVNPKREFLDEEEVKKLIVTDCKYPRLKDAFLFSCLSGLRWSDVVQLKWRDVRIVEKGYVIQFKQKKTKNYEYLPVSEKAVSFLGKREEEGDKVFHGLRYSGWYNTGIVQWMVAAGITKHITFHCARHTFATLLLNNGTDIYTVSKLLGHSEIKTTQIYAKVMDDNKRGAVDVLGNLI